MIKNSSGYHYLAAKKPSALFEKNLLNHNFQTDRILKKHELFLKNHDYLFIIMLQKFKMVLNKATNEMEELGANTLKDQLGNRS